LNPPERHWPFGHPSLFKVREMHTTDHSIALRREARLRRLAAKHGLTVRKSRRRDPYVSDFGCYAIEDAATRCLLHVQNPIGSPFALSLDEAEDFVANG
jgi:hypothetical protein